MGCIDYALLAVIHLSDYIQLEDVQTPKTMSEPTVPKTIDDLLDYPTAAENMTDDQLAAFLRPYFPHTRPGKVLAAEVQQHERASKVISDEDLLAEIRRKKAERLAAQQTKT